MRTHVIVAVLKRNLMSYFSGLLGYLFIIFFVVAASLAAFNPQFFTNNLATLDQLTRYFPFLLLFIVPAIAMTAWADEKRQGTDELLFTLPGTDTEILLGKYLSLVLVYAVALGFSMTMFGILALIADPDWGLLLTTYFGYWLAGAALISLAMFASVMTSSVTVAFGIGVAFCAIPVFIGNLAVSRPFVEEPTFGDWLADGFSQVCLSLSLSERLREFAMGVVPFSGLVYFGSLIAFALYLNRAMISRRHWVRSGDGVPMGAHCGVRVVCLLIALIAGNSVISTASESMGLRFDMTAENLYTLSDTTTDLIDNIEEQNPVTVLAYMSPTVPREYVAQQTQLRGLLRQYDQMGGGLLNVRFVDVTPFSEEAEEASHFGIAPQTVQSEVNGRFQAVEVFLGAVVQSPFDQVVIPFFESGASIEYELTRSIRTVSQEERLTVGVLRTDAKVNGGFDMQSMRSQPEWRISQELKKQYKVVEVAADSAIDEEMDVLLAVQPSALNQQQMDNFVTYVKSGEPVLILDDPMPITNLGNAPSQPKRPAGNPMMGQQQPPEPRADYSALLTALGIEWKNDSLIWDTVNPHPQWVDLPQDYVFVTKVSGNPEAFNSESDVTSGLQELLVLYPGEVLEDTNADVEFTSLLQTGAASGKNEFGDLVENSFFGTQPKDPRRIIRDADKFAHVIAGRVEGKGDNKVNAIFVADTDFISDQIFSIAQNEAFGLKLDNVKFILNCVDVLSGDTSYVELRKRRPQHRALLEVQRQTDQFRKDVAEETKKAEEDAEEQKEKKQEELDKQVEEIDNNPNLSRMEKEQQKQIALQKKRRELEVEEANIDREKDKKLEQLRARQQRNIQAVENKFWWNSVLWPPVPAVLLGLAVLIMRLNAEGQHIEEARRKK